MNFDIALNPINPLIQLSDGTQYRFTGLSDWSHEWEPVKIERELIIPRGKKANVVLGFRLIATGRWSPLPNAEKKPSGGSWSEIPGYEALVDIHNATEVLYAPWASTFYAMTIESELNWSKKRRYERESGILTMESVELMENITDISEGGV